MSTQRSRGRCPACDRTVPESRVLIEYEREGRRTAFAECPECGSVVRPQ